MGKRIRFIAGALVGALVQYLYDPDRGRSRRARLRDQLGARLRDLREEATRRARYERGRLKGFVYETTKGDDPMRESEADDELILQRIRSEVIGPARAQGDTIDLRVDDGVVVLIGTPRDERELTERIRQVAGVRQVINE